jgi:hypothetical protein
MAGYRLNFTPYERRRYITVTIQDRHELAKVKVNFSLRYP